jgi:hypothetical protein
MKSLLRVRRLGLTRKNRHRRVGVYADDMTTKRTRELSPQALVMAQIADEDKPMPSDKDVKEIAREHHLPPTEADALVRFARAVSKMAGEWER